MIRILLVILGFFIFLPLKAQVDFNWANQLSGNYNITHASTSDVDGNRYSVGTFTGTVDFDPGANTNNYTDLETSVYIHKVDSDGNFIWVKLLPLYFSANAGLLDIQLDNNGALYLSGYVYGGTIDLDPGLDSNAIMSISAADGFIAKYDTSGNYIWHKQIAGLYDQVVSGLVFDSQLNVIAFGHFNDNTNFNYGGVPYNVWSNAFSPDLFIAKYDSSGSLMFVKTLTGNNIDELPDVKLDPNDNIFIAGTFYSSVDFDPDTSNHIINPGYQSAYICKWSSSGSFIWVKHTQSATVSPHGMQSYSLEINNDQELYLFGIFGDTADLDMGPSQYLAINPNTNNFYVAKYDSNANFIWAKHFPCHFGGSSYDGVSETDIDNAGNIYVQSIFDYTEDFDPGPGITNLTAHPSGHPAIFVSKFNAQGEFIWANAILGNPVMTIQDLDILPNREILLSGCFRGPTDFDPGPSSFTLNTPFAEENSCMVSLLQNACSDFHIVTDSAINNSCLGMGYIALHGAAGFPPYNYQWGIIPPVTDSTLSINISGIYPIFINDQMGCTSSTSYIINGPNLISQDLKVNALATEFRPGFNSYIWLDGFNEACDTISGEMGIVLDPLLSFTSSIPSPDLISGDTLMWYFTANNYDSLHLTPQLEVYTSLAATIGDSIALITYINPQIGDFDTTDNYKSYKYPVVNGYDPNDKQVYPQGKCVNHYVLNDQKLTYSIRFQNTGNSEAINIYILDTIDTDLNIETVKITGTSHPMYTQLFNNNVLRFSFDNIHLPDSNTNEPLSHGYLIFEIYPDSGLTNDTYIENTANIYFDFNPAVITNTVFNTVYDHLFDCATIGVNEYVQLDVEVYPNPTSDIIYIESKQNQIDLSWRISSLSGTTLIHQGPTATSVSRIDLSNLPVGIYILEISGEYGKVMKKVIKS